MAKIKDRDEGFAGIRSYEELDATLRMVRREISMNQTSRQISRLAAPGGFNWTDAALHLVGALKGRLRKK